MHVSRISGKKGCDTFNCVTERISRKCSPGFDSPCYLKPKRFPAQRTYTSSIDSPRDNDTDATNYLSHYIKPSSDSVPHDNRPGFNSHSTSPKAYHSIYRVPNVLSFPTSAGFHTRSPDSMENKKIELHKYFETRPFPFLDNHKFGDDLSNWKQRCHEKIKTGQLLESHKRIHKPYFHQIDEILPPPQVHDPQVLLPPRKSELEETCLDRTFLATKNERLLKMGGFATNNMNIFRRNHDEHLVKTTDHWRNNIDFPGNNKEESNTYKMDHEIDNNIILNQQRNGLTMQDIHNRASEKVKEQTTSNNNHPKIKIGIADIKNKLSESGSTFVQKERESESNQTKNNVKSMKQKLVDQYFSQMNTPQQPSDNTLQKCDNGQVAVSESISKTKNLFETKAREDQTNIPEPNSSSTFKKNSVNVPSIFTQNLQNQSPTEEDPSIRKSSFEWKYKKKSILDFQQFIEENKGLVPNEISQGCAKIATNLTHDGLNTNVKTENHVVDKSEERSIEEYNTLMKAVDSYLAAPDKSTNEIDFKSEVERYLDLIEEPERVPSQTISTIANDRNVVRRPKKLDLSQGNGSRPKSQYEKLLAQVEDQPDIAPMNKKPSSKSIKNLQNKLLSDTAGKSMEKEDLQLHIAGADQIKKEYEKLNKLEDKALLSAPKSTLQKAFAQMKDEIVPEKTLENLKAKHHQQDWKWKQKSMNDLNTSIKMFKDHGINTPPKIEEQHKKLVKTTFLLC